MTTAAQKMADDVIAAVRDYLQRCLAPLALRVSAVEGKFADKPLQGQRGEAGPQGEPGPAGQDGAPGPQGERGEKGSDGPPGPQGEKGDTGEKGDQGPQGDPGVDGAAGPAGAKGDAGVDGPAGADGLRGEKGDPGEKGEQGAAGPQGEPGPAGKDGTDGQRGADGAPGEKGDPGPKGDQGEAGAAGRDGREGEPGRDAVALDVLDGLDVAKRYPRGTFAAWRGGMVRSFRSTDPLADGDLGKAGWHVVMRGIAEEAFDIDDDLRTVRRRVEYTDGQRIEKTLSIPALLYRGIWKDDVDYAQGDCTTRDGCTWVLVLPKQIGKPGEPDSGWQLSVKRGRDGRDGIRGEKGERGAEGRAGKDLTQMGGGAKW